MPTVTGWLFDLYPSPGGMTVWIADDAGLRHRCHAPFKPFFFMHVGDDDARRAAAIVRTFPFPVTIDRVTQKDLYANEDRDVLRLRVHDVLRARHAVQKLERHFPHYVFYNSDIPAQQLFLYTTGLFPLARGEYAIDADGTLAQWRLDDAPEALEYSMPDLTRMTIKNHPDIVSPKHRRSVQLEVTYDGNTYALEANDPSEIVRSLQNHLLRCDPDIILTEYGDAVLMPMLSGIARRHQLPLTLNRDPAAGFVTSRERTYFAYGQVVHKDGAFELAGRWHLDTENSFMMGEASLDGVIEIARLTQLPVQHQSRATIGSALSSMQLSWAFRNNYLIPARKREPEAFKSASTLLLADRGGLIYQPEPGMHEQVAELDFVSMYPTIMVEHNVSPETVNCRCCENDTVPELHYTICEKRRGIVPSTLETVVRKRGVYKKLKKELKAAGDPRWTIYDRRQTALKWMLVTCFGYLGYKNARFGRIEAHESVNAYAREGILRAKEIAEARGFRFLHAIIDCMWLTRPGATRQDYEDLANEVSRAVGITISLEGIYRWLIFPSSKIDPLLPTANRYVGWYESDEIKIRGIEIRRRDTPKFIKRMQGEMLKIFGLAMDIAGLRARSPEALAVAREFAGTLLAGKADPLELVVRRHITRNPEEYATRTVTAEASKALAEAGMPLKAGEAIEYIVVDASGRRKPEKARPVALYAFEDGYDQLFYGELLCKAAETLLLPFGYDAARLKEMFGFTKAKKKQAPARNQTQYELFG